MSAIGAKTSAGAGAQPLSGPARILLVDDLPANLAALNALLRQDAVEILEASSGDAALELLLVHDFALAIIDVQMPGMNGFELAVLMRGTEHTRHVPIIFITAGAHNPQNRFQGYEAGAVDFLFKPIEPDVLRHKTAIFLELYRSRQEIARQRDTLHLQQQQLAAELKAAELLQDLSTKLIQADQLGALHEQILDTARVVMNADVAMLHVGGDGTADLRLLGHRGLHAAALSFWTHVPAASQTPCAVALRTGRRVMIRDVLSEPSLKGNSVLQVCRDSGIRALQSTPLRSRAGEVLGTISTGWQQPHDPGESALRSLDVVARQAADLMERTRAAVALQQSNDRLRFMAESMPQKIFTARADGFVDYVNENWREFTGLVLPAMHGAGWHQCVHPDDLGDLARRWEESIRTGGQFEMEHRLQRADGLYRWHLTRAQAMRDGAGAVTMWIGSSTEIHTQKETEVGLRRLNDDLKYFAYAASHDLQEPLRMIQCYAEMLVRGYPGGPEGPHAVWMQHVTQGTRRMRELLGDLLAYTQVAQEECAVSNPADLNLIVEAARRNLSAVIEEAGAQIHCDHLPTVPGREIHFVQLFQNLIANALKYRSEAPPRIRITAARHADEWRFALSDNGIGIAPEYHQQIFGVFKRLHGKAIPGTGVGLSICQRVVELYGGRIWVESEAGRGATFRFTLRAAAADRL